MPAEAGAPPGMAYGLMFRMQERPRNPEHAWAGTIRIFIAELLILPTGIATVSFLTRKLGPHDFGVLALASTLVVWLEVSLTVLYGKVTVKWVAEAEDWRHAGAMTMRLHLFTGLCAAALLFLLAPIVASSLHTPELAAVLRIYSLDIPLFALGQAHRQILVGLGAFTERALVGAARWTSRMVLILAFVGAGLSLNGAVLGNIGASIAELLLARYYVQPPLYSGGRRRWPEFWAYVIPLSAFSMSMRLFDKLDLFLLKLMGCSAEVAGFYGAAQNLSILPSIFALSFSSLLISTLARSLQRGETADATRLMRDTWRALLLLLPLASIIAGSATEIVRLFFGKEFLPAGSQVAWLIFAAIGVAAISIHSSVLTVSQRPMWTLGLVGPVLLLSVPAYMAVIPTYGAVGAAAVTTAASVLGAAVTAAACYSLWRVLPPIGTVLRTVLISAAAWVVAAQWHTPGLTVVLKDCLLGVATMTAYAATGEVRSEEFRAMRSLFQGRGGVEPGA
ncbi:MAG TPA: oligosaccharide flippase family protein [Acidobacteriota bacterium]|nr:oligosaccharide flippase family protein [Acidobacteriota bacterium]